MYLVTVEQEGEHRNKQTYVEDVARYVKKKRRMGWRYRVGRMTDDRFVKAVK